MSEETKAHKVVRSDSSGVTPPLVKTTLVI